MKASFFRRNPVIPFLVFVAVALCFSFSTGGGSHGIVGPAKCEYRAHGDTLRYRLYQPAGDAKLPLILFLHGAGERGRDNEAQLGHSARYLLDSLFQKQHPCIVLAPQCPNGLRWVETDWKLPKHTQPDTLSRPMALLLPLLDSLLKVLPVDTNRIYITGLSMGGFGTWDLIQRYPGRFAAAVPVCGGGDEAQAAQLAHIPLWVFHGAKDNVVTVNRSRNMVAAVKKAGGKPRYTEYPQLKHNCWDSTYSNPKLYDWLFAQSKKK